MNPQQEIIRHQLQAIADQMMLQFGTVLFLSIGYFFGVAALIAIILDLRRTALGFFFLIGLATFLVPSPITYLFSPLMMAAALGSFLWLSLRGRKKRGVTSV